jgi:hypothetical protein
MGLREKLEVLLVAGRVGMIRDDTVLGLGELFPLLRNWSMSILVMMMTLPSSPQSRKDF